jgi:hypothetical protein
MSGNGTGDGSDIVVPGPAQVREALAGGPLAGMAARDAARELTAVFPGAPGLPAALWGLHRNLARLMVAGPGAASSVIFAAAGIAPRDTLLHGPAMLAAPLARFCYLDPDPLGSEWNRALLADADPGRVCAATAHGRDPVAVLEAAEAGGIDVTRRLSVHLTGSPQRWEPGAAREVLAGYAALLAPGSSVVLSMGGIAPGRDGDRYLEAMAACAGPTWRYTAEDAASWVTGAGMRLAGHASACAWGRAARGAGDLVRVNAVIGIVRR